MRRNHPLVVCAEGKSAFFVFISEEGKFFGAAGDESGGTTDPKMAGHNMLPGDGSGVQARDFLRVKKEYIAVYHDSDSNEGEIMRVALSHTFSFLCCVRCVCVKCVGFCVRVCRVDGILNEEQVDFLSI